MRNFNEYQLNLEKSLKQKLFFLDKINIAEYDLIVDYGCETGIVLNEIKKRTDKLISTNKLSTNPTLIGYDYNYEMIHLCKEKYEDILFTYNQDQIRTNLNNYKKKLIIFSSVLHEMKDSEQLEAIEFIMPLFDTVVIRDMKRPINNEPISNITRRRILSKVPKWQAKKFEKKWGKIVDKIGMYRFFLMNEFVDNFDTEVEEDYFCVKWSHIEWTLEDKNFKPLYVSSYTLPYRKKQVQKVFKHNMNDITHREAIYMKEDNDE